MIVIAGIVLGIFVGIRRARSRDGNRLDMAQYAAVHAIIFGLGGLILTIVLERLG